jgi:glucosamine--fructose-6-phosphate aminotransferase (isomerizing)
MEYEMYREMTEQPQSLRNTLKEERSHLKEIASQFKKFDKIYLVGCGSSLSTCFSAKDAANMTFNNNLDVYTGYEFFYHKNIDDENAGVILTSQSGETADTLAALRKSQKKGIYTVSITNEGDSSMMNESDDAVLTLCQRENAILGTKTYMTQLLCLYEIIFGMDNSDASKEVLRDLEKVPSVVEDLLKATE